MTYEPYDFFFSYPRAEAKSDAYLMRFYADLSKEVRRLRGLDPAIRVGFLDQTDIARGAEWQRTLFAALNQSRTIVPLYMPAFYNSDDCMRELELFQSRLQGLQRQHPVVKAVLWTTGVVPIPPQLGTLQYTVGDPGDPINAKGVLHALRKNLRRPYTDFIEQLANDIATAANEGPLPPIQGAYEGSQPRVTASLDLAGPGHVHFVYVATSSDALPQLRTGESYGAASRSWRPFHPPTTQAIGPLTQEVAGSHDFTSDELRFDRDLLTAIREAERKRNLVVLVVDGWSVQLAEYDEVLRLIDERNFLNVSVLVPYNENDAATMASSNDLKIAVRDALARWVAPGDMLRFNDTITTLPQLKTTLADTLTRLRAQVFNAGSNRPRPAIPRPVLTNIGTAA